ncbi:MAG: hypothetical protein E6772_03780 [Dysgonomonas sp.]|nr:hypothetical protein [Dysgonomonas sp.]
MKTSIFKLFLATLLLGITFNSCTDDHDATAQGELYCDFNMVTENYTGYFGQRQVYDVYDISLDGRYSSIHKIYYLGTQIEITGAIQRGDLIRDIVIDINGVGKYSLPAIEVYRDNEVISYTTRDDRGLYNFMNNAIDRLNAYNEMDIIVSGQLIDRNGYVVEAAGLRISMTNMLDVDASY